MSDPTFFRGRLNGAATEADGTVDPSSPPGERQALVTFIGEDTDTGTSTPRQGIAKVYLPNNVPCPLYAANIYFFSLVDGPLSLPLDRALQPKVIIRRDADGDEGTTGCYSIVINPTLIGMFQTQWVDTSKVTVYGPDTVVVDFIDPSGAVAAGKAAFFPLIDANQNQDVLFPKGLVIATARYTEGAPSGHTYAWHIQPASNGNTMPCKITGGSGDTYTCDFYGNGDLTTVTESGVTVQQLLITGTSLPSGTWTIASRVGGVWYMQVPVWVA